ncbi:MAG: hypothetical protein U0Y96_02390 [Candidatus Kapaibacterium sp.]|nr:hypothetical protein [Bacteroidota bacterium]
MIILRIAVIGSVLLWCGSIVVCFALMIARYNRCSIRKWLQTIIPIQKLEQLVISSIVLVPAVSWLLFQWAKVTVTITPVHWDEYYFDIVLICGMMWTVLTFFTTIGFLIGLVRPAYLLFRGYKELITSYILCTFYTVGMLLLVHTVLTLF